MKCPCPECGKDVPVREFYDHMCEYHGWTMAQAEEYADNVYLNEHPEVCPKCGGKREYTMWNTEKGDDEGYHCLNCDRYFPNFKTRRSGGTEA